jgi:hypothetical protein
VIAVKTIAELAQRERDLMAELAEVRVEISERAGQTDPEPEPVKAAPERKGK